MGKLDGIGYTLSPSGQSDRFGPISAPYACVCARGACTHARQVHVCVCTPVHTRTHTQARTRLLRRWKPK